MNDEVTQMIVLDPEQWEYVRSRATWWRYFAVACMMLAALSSLSLVVNRIYDGRRETRLEALAIDNHRTLKILEDATGPDAAARQKAQLDNSLQIIDCNQRKAIQDLVDQLVSQGVIDPIIVICKENP